METRNVCAPIPVATHRRLRAYLARHDVCVRSLIAHLVTNYVDSVVAAEEAESFRELRAQAVPTNTAPDPIEEIIDAL